ncbi:hypothetical protein L7F22_065657 [Adiantum nelumboides]|nr:hypothetical protein [Adiantum nelumboides]
MDEQREVGGIEICHSVFPHEAAGPGGHGSSVTMARDEKKVKECLAPRVGNKGSRKVGLVSLRQSRRLHIEEEVSEVSIPKPQGSYKSKGSAIPSLPPLAALSCAKLVSASRQGIQGSHSMKARRQGGSTAARPPSPHEGMAAS